MERRILFISEQKNFLVSAMTKSLTDAKFEVIKTEPSTAEIKGIVNLPDIFVVYLEGDINAFSTTLSYLKELMTEEIKDRALYLIGNQKEIEMAYDIVPSNFVSYAFTRPVNMKDVINKINVVISNEFGATPGVKKILVVDDDSVMLRTMKMWLAGYDVYMANSGMNAIQFLAQNTVDLILLDYEMPVASGLQVFEMLKADEKTARIPIIFLTSKDDKDTVMKVISAKPEKYLLKSMKPEELVNAVDDFFKGTKSSFAVPTAVL